MLQVNYVTGIANLKIMSRHVWGSNLSHINNDEGFQVTLSYEMHLIKSPHLDVHVSNVYLLRHKLLYNILSWLIKYSSIPLFFTALQTSFFFFFFTLLSHYHVLCVEQHRTDVCLEHYKGPVACWVQ